MRFDAQKPQMCPTVTIVKNAAQITGLILSISRYTVEYGRLLFILC